MTSITVMTIDQLDAELMDSEVRLDTATNAEYALIRDIEIYLQNQLTTARALRVAAL